MNGWISIWMDGQVDEWMDRWLGVWVASGCLGGGQIDEWRDIGRCVDGLIDGKMNRRWMVWIDV